MNDSSDQVYKLRCSLLGHVMDVRGVAAGQTEGGKEFIISGSRDKSTKVWIPSDDGGFTPFQSCEGHTNFVSCVYAIPPNNNHPTGLILSGGHDHTILAFELGKQQPVFRLIGHKGTVCSIGGTGDSLIVSGSWDLTAKVWAEKENVATLTGHEAAVWAVATVPGPDHKILTGSADKDIRLWVNYTSTIVFRGHTDCVRTLAVVDSEKFLSGSNDASIRLWSITQGGVLDVFYGHTNFIYSISLLPQGKGFVSVGEDRTLRIWKSDKTVQVLFHPATSVWCVTALQNGDIATGSSDGSVRVFTCAPERIGSPEVLAAFEEEVSKAVVAAQQDLGGMKVSELPGPESLMSEGKHDGETKMVREGDKVGCYSWSVSDQKWTKVGDVVGASGATQNTSGRVLHEGKEYDYVFTVDLDEQGTLKLPYNVTDDPWFAAQKFIHKNELSQMFLDQVANFIINNTKGMQLGTEAGSSNFADPFTGGNRYVPGSNNSSGPTVGGQDGLDPFTGSGAYRTAASSANAAKSSVSSTELNNASSGPCFPVREFVRFSAAPNYDALRKKLVEFIHALGPAAGISEESVDALLDIGRKPKWNEAINSQILNCLASWPADKIFPILDLLRLGILNTEFVEKFSESIDITTEFSGKFISKDTPTNQMLSLRLLANSFGSLKVTDRLLADRPLVVSQILNNLTKNKNNEIAASTVLLNYSIAVSGLLSNENSKGGWSTIESQTEVLMAAVSLIEVLEEPEATFRILVVIGNIISGNPSLGDLFKNLNGESVLNGFKAHGALPKIQNCALQIQSALATPVPGSSKTA